MKCFEFKILYSSCFGAVSYAKAPRRRRDAYLSSSIYNLSGVVLAIVFDNSTESILNCGVVALHEMMLDKADCERRFAWNTKKSET